jgi:hypothetical protein
MYTVQKTVTDLLFEWGWGGTELRGNEFLGQQMTDADASLSSLHTHTSTYPHTNNSRKLCTKLLLRMIPLAQIKFKANQVKTAGWERRRTRFLHTIGIPHQT